MTLHYPKGSLDANKAAVCWKEFFDDHATEFDATAISSPTIDAASQPAVVYDLQGRKIEGKAMSKDLYILNGKKVILK